MKNKENASRDFVEMIKNSWTYDRMTETLQNGEKKTRKIYHFLHK